MNGTLPAPIVHESRKISIEKPRAHEKRSSRNLSKRRQNHRVEAVGGQPLVKCVRLKCRCHKGTDLGRRLAIHDEGRTSIWAHLLLGQPLAIMSVTDVNGFVWKVVLIPF